MMGNFLDTFFGKEVLIELTGEGRHIGILIDAGSDILVLYDGTQYVYLPFLHVKHLKLNINIKNAKIPTPTDSEPFDNRDEITYRKILTNAKGLFVKLNVTGNQLIHGYVTNVLTNYFVFYSPAYKTMYIPLLHLKWLIPYNSNTSLYALENDFFPVNPSTIPLSRTFEEQLKKLEGKLIFLDLGTHSHKIGQLNKVDKGVIEFITADETRLFYNIDHIKTVHSPYLT
ncbi:DUF2642 domain-containing protein [Aneurinibacillus terranovensis]|uniref:DUF2642 domain-containing protein n=1 Tax=Aneurinibacillus terranovensis TaxID=278991 RepID=UPI000423D53E|nr:DUF2642 domain-containing protein [Aneurinibacillus terranovensis]